MHLLPCIALLLTSIAYTQACCSPSVFQMHAMEYGFVAQGKTADQNMVLYYYDEDNQRVATVTTTNMMEQKVRQIYDFRAKKRYIIKGSECNVTDLTTSFPKNCLPPSAVFMGSSVLGNDKDSLQVNNFGLNITQFNRSYEFSFMVAPRKEGECTFVGMVIYMKDEEGYQKMGTFISMDYSFEITDKSVFQPPKQCSEPTERGFLLFDVFAGFQRDGFNL